MPENEKGKARDQSEPDSLDSAKSPPAPKPSVHYPSDLRAPYASKRVDSSEEFGFKASSIAPSYDDFDDEDYDWSTEDDLVDEEIKKFQKEAGVRKERRSRFVM